MNKNYKVIDTFLFNDELEMLKMRLDYLNDSVEYFVIAESTRTTTGNLKELTYSSNSYLFDEYKDKIHYVVYEPTEDDLNKSIEDKWHLEIQQIECLRKKALEISDDDCFILLSGVDEFPKKELFDNAWNIVKDKTLEAVSFKMKTFYYSPLTELLIDCFASVGINNSTLKEVNMFNDLRQYAFNCPNIENGGYHLSFFMTPEKIQTKILNFSHREYNTPEYSNLEKIKQRIYNGTDIFERPECPTKHYKEISDEFPIEFYRHEIFFRNTFNRLPLKLQSKLRKEGSMQIALEIENLQLTVARHEPKVVVEIGTANGGTLSRWLELPSVETVISVDYPIGIHGGQGFEERTYVISDALEQANLYNKKFYAVNGNSKDSYLIDRVEELLNGQKIDFLFIDGDHTYEGVKGDFELYEKFLAPTALVGFHDIINSYFHREANCFVSTFWEELKEKYGFVEFIYTQFLDQKSLPFFYEFTYNKGGFAGIGYIDYSKKKEDKPDLTLVVPIYNNVDDTINNVNITLGTSTIINQVILYSNGTEEEGNKKLEAFAATNPIIELYIKKEALGFVKAVNEAFKLAKNENIMCLNSDANLHSNWEELLLPLLKDKSNGLIGPVKVGDYILGCCSVIRKSVINKIGLLDEGFGLGYSDDVEISYRVQNNGYNLGYICYMDNNQWNPGVTFPLIHKQGESFKLLEPDKTSGIVKYNLSKCKKLMDSTQVKVLKDLPYKDIQKHLNLDEVIIIVNHSGDEFEKIRFDEEIIKVAHVYECTPSMNIDTLIKSLTNNKTANIIANNKPKLTWLAKYDDYASMGILSQRLLEQLDNNINLACKPIIGVTETKNSLVHSLLKKPLNTDLGIMFAYPDSIGHLNEFKTKVVYTGVDTTDEAGNFVVNGNKADFLLTPSNISKTRIQNMGVTKPIFVVPHGIDPKVFTYTPKIKEDKFKFLYVGECSDRKGIFHTLEAFIDLFKNNNNVELHIKSNDSMLFYNSQEVKNIIKDHKNIFWHISNDGHDKVMDLYRSCHAYVYPSRGDSFGMTILEAIACGLPTIATSEPGSTELIKDRYYNVSTKSVSVKNHPWFKGEWGEPNVKDLIKHMKHIYDNYDSIVKSGVLKENSDYVRENYSWEKIANDFEINILPKLLKPTKVLTLLTSFNRSHHIKNIINSLKDIQEPGIINDIYIVDNSNPENKEEILKVINENINNNFTVYSSEFNMGQRGAMLQMFDNMNIDDYDFIQFTDQDNLFNEPISTYCDILNTYPDRYVATGYMSKEHGELGWLETQFGNLCVKGSCRAGHMVMRAKDIKDMMPIHLDSQHNNPQVNSSWNAGLDWELTYWNPKSPGAQGKQNFILCVPGGVLHKGIDSTLYDWPVEENEYKLEELIELRKNKF